MRVYLAGPDVFMPNPHGRAALLKAICARHNLIGVSPLDPLSDEPAEWAGLTEALRIARRNEAHIAGAAVLVANLTPFRGPSADAGTVFELGYMRALGRPVFGWSNATELFADRTRASFGGGAVDPEGMQIEDFGLSDNLMIEAAIAASGGSFTRINCPQATRWDRLEAFEACLSDVVKLAQRGRHAKRPG